MRVTCDSDVLSNFGLRRGRGAREVFEAIQANALSLNVICLFEVRGGMEDAARIAEFDRCFAHLPVLEFTREAAIRAGDLWRALRSRKRTLAIRDLFLAALADAHRVRLITADHDFTPLQDLGLDITIITEDTHLPSS
jgi:predicted nucleic acid-binding protein